MTDTPIFLCVYGLLLAVPLFLYIRWQAKKEKQIRETLAAGQVYSEGPKGQHPQIDLTNCIGCQLCTRVCPEGDVLSMVGGKAAFVKPHKCIGHSLCAEACPVGAITMVRAIPGLSADMPYLTDELETSVPNMYIAGELGGLALIKNAARQGLEVIDVVARRLETLARPGVEDVVIVGAGPAGISATLRAIERKLKYVTLERDTLGGTVSKYPRQKVVMTSPIQFPLGITLKKMQLSKENLLAFWQTVCNREDFKVNENEAVSSIKKEPDGTFTIVTSKTE